MNSLKFSILIPTYNVESTIKETLASILSQNYRNFEIIIQDNNSQDKTREIIKSIKDQRIRLFNNRRNLGAPRSLIRGRQNCTGDIIFLMAGDDILGKDVLDETYKAFKISDDIGAVTRPYYWFDKSIRIPVRAKKQLDSKKDTIIYANEKDINKIYEILSTLDQLSGLAYRKKYLKETFRNDLWTCHSYPFLSILKNHPIVFLRDYTITVRMGRSATRANIYEKSPMKSWIKMFEDVFSEEKFHEMKKKCIENFVATNYVGLVQIKNYGTLKSLLREIFYLIKYRPKNIFNPLFWSFSLGCLIIPSFLLIPLVDWYKNKINCKIIKKTNFKYDINYI